MASERVTLENIERAGSLNSVQAERLAKLRASNAQGDPFDRNWSGTYDLVNAPMWYDSQGNQTTEPPEVFIQRVSQELEQEMTKMSDRLSQYDKEHPFAFDELLARASAEERFNPYYQAELRDFITGIQREKQSTEGERNLLAELNRIAAGAEKRNVDEAIRASEEGYAGAGLYSSGAKERATGLLQIQGQEKQQGRELEYKYKNEELGRGIQDLLSREQTGRRRTLAEQTTTIESDIAKQKAEERSRWDYEKAQYVGYPYVQQNTAGLQDLLKNSFQY